MGLGKEAGQTQQVSGLEKELRRSLGLHSPPQPPGQLQPSQPCCPPLPACSGRGCKDLNPFSTHTEGGWPQGACLSSCPLSQNRAGHKRLWPDMGAGGIGATFTGALGTGPVLAAPVWHRKAWTETRGLGPGLAMLPNGRVARATQSSSEPQYQLGPRPG